MQQKKVGTADHIFLRDGSAAIAGADKQTTAITLGFADTDDEFMNATWLEDLVVVALTSVSLLTSTRTLPQPPSSSQRVASSVARMTAASSRRRWSWPK
jgi:hypothetical protein